MRIVVTGGAGFIGKHLLGWLVCNGHDVLAIDDFSRGRPEHVPPSVDAQIADLAEMTAADLARQFETFGAESVVHLAAVHFIPECMKNPERTFAINTKSTHTVIEAVRLSEVSRVVIASTLDVYKAADRVHDEDDGPKPSNIYGLTKALSEQLLEYAVRVGDCQSGIALRLANVYGPDETNPHVIPDILKRIMKRDSPSLVMGYLGAARDFVHVKDVARAFGIAVTEGPSGFHALNTGTGSAVPVRAVVRTLQGLLGDNRPVHEDAATFRKFDRVSLTPNVDAIARVLGWHAEIQIADGLQAMVAAMLAEPAEQAA
jgi:UDP-glucose 4-epimerase